MKTTNKLLEKYISNYKKCSYDYKDKYRQEGCIKSYNDYANAAIPLFFLVESKEPNG